MIRSAEADDVDAIQALLRACVRDLRVRGIRQWDDVYPDVEAVASDVDAGTVWVAESAGAIVGSVCLNALQDAQYARVEWRHAEPALIVHRLCVAPHARGQGIAARLMAFAEAYGAEHSFASIRLDVYTGNPAALRLYERFSFTTAGQVFFPRRDLPFLCMEKPLARQRGESAVPG